MTATPGLGTYDDGFGRVTPLAHKMAQAGLIVKTGANTIRPGLFWDGSATVVTGAANMSYNVRAFAAVTSRGATAGAVLLTNDATYNVATTAAPGSNSRIDSVYIWPREFSLDGTDSIPVIGVEQGTAAAVPTAPSLAAYPGAIELARIVVPAGVTATNSGTTFTQTAPFTTVDGGVVVCRNQTEMDAYTPVRTDARAHNLANGIEYTWDGAAWKPIGTGLVPVIPTSVAGTGVTLGAGGTVTAVAATSVSINGCFTSDFENYKILITVTGQSASADIAVKLRLSGTDSTTGYSWIRAYDTTTTRTVLTTTGTTGWVLGAIGASFASHQEEITIMGPAIAAVTTGSGTGMAGATMVSSQYSWYHSTTTAYDGISFVPGSGNVTGKIRVYGWNDN